MVKKMIGGMTERRKSFNIFCPLSSLFIILYHMFIVVIKCVFTLDKNKRVCNNIYQKWFLMTTEYTDHIVSFEEAKEKN
jgi:hypothetical protein